MSIPVLLSAVRMPGARSGLLSRYRLIKLLYRLIENKLILVTACPGYGKTSLLIDFANQKGIKACWYAIDRYDQDLKCFLAHLIAAIQRLYPGFGASSSAALESLDGSPDDIEAIVTTIANELYANVDEYFLIILDDYHLLGDNPSIHAFVSRFISRVDENCHLVISSRQRPPLPDLELLLARGQVGQINTKDLAFSAEETYSLLHKSLQPVSQAQAEALTRRTEGWITGIQLTPVAALFDADGRGCLPGAYPGSKDMAAYWNLLLKEQPSEIRKFLLLSSPLDYFDVSLCQQVLAPDFPVDTNWGALLEKVASSSLFVLPADDERIGLRYHNLFQTHLQNLLKEEYPGYFEIILERLADLHCKAHEWEQAYHIADRLENLALQIEIMECAGPAMLKNGRFDTLSDWLDKLPASELQSRPCLLSLKGGAALMGDNIQAGLEMLNRAEATLRVSNNRSCLARTLVRRSTAHYFLGHYPLALQDAEDALEVIGEDQGLMGVRAQALKSRGISLHCLDRHEEGIQDVQNALALYKDLDDKPNIASLQQELGVIYEATGNAQAALAAFSKANTYWRSKNDYYRLADLLNNLGLLYHHQGEYEQAVATFDEGLKYARLTGFVRLQAFLLTSLGDLYADIWEARDAQEVFASALDIARKIKNRFLCFYVQLGLARLARTNGHLDEALVLHQQAAEFALDGSGFEQGHLGLENARLALASEQLPQAVQFLELAARHFQPAKLAVEQAQVQFYLAAAFFELGENERSRQHLQNALDLAVNTRAYYALVVAGRYAEPVLEYASKDPKLGRQAAALLTWLRQWEANLPEIRRSLRRQVSEAPVTAPKIQIQALGAMKITLNGKVTNSIEWKSQNQRDILFYLLQHPEGATKDTLYALFWKQADDYGTQLSNAIYRMGRNLGDKLVKYQDGRYYFNRDLDFEYDVEVFQVHAARAKNETDPEKRIQALQSAIAMYHGIYLPEANGTWAIPERERLYQIYVRSVVALAETYRDAGKYQTSLDCCLDALDQDDCQEQFYRQAMLTCDAMGDQASVDYYFKLCEQALVNVHGTIPSQETRDLHEQLTRQRVRR